MSSFCAQILGVISHPGCVAKSATSPVCLMPVESIRARSLFVMYWRDCVGIEPTEPDTQAPQGFEDPGGHQSPIQPPY